MANDYDGVITDPGAGGARVAGSNFDDAGTTTFMPASTIAVPASGGGFDLVGTSHGLPTSWPVTTLKKSYEKQTAIAAGGSATFDSTQLTTATTGKLFYAKVNSSVAFKATLYKVANGVASAAVDEDYGWNGRFEWRSPHPDMVSQAESATAGLDGFRIVVVNLDPTLAADISVVFVWDES